MFQPDGYNYLETNQSPVFPIEQNQAFWIFAKVEIDNILLTIKVLVQDWILYICRFRDRYF